MRRRRSPPISGRNRRGDHLPGVVRIEAHGGIPRSIDWRGAGAHQEAPDRAEECAPPRARLTHGSGRAESHA